MPKAKIQYAIVRIESDKNLDEVVDQMVTVLAQLEHDISALTRIDITTVHDQHPMAEENGEQPILYWP